MKNDQLRDHLALKDGSWGLYAIEDEEVCRMCMDNCSMPQSLMELVQSADAGTTLLKLKVSTQPVQCILLHILWLLMGRCGELFRAGFGVALAVSH